MAGRQAGGAGGRVATGSQGVGRGLRAGRYRERGVCRIRWEGRDGVGRGSSAVQCRSERSRGPVRSVPPLGAERGALSQGARSGEWSRRAPGSRLQAPGSERRSGGCWGGVHCASKQWYLGRRARWEGGRSRGLLLGTWGWLQAKPQSQAFIGEPEATGRGKRGPGQRRRGRGRGGGSNGRCSLSLEP